MSDIQRISSGADYDIAKYYLSVFSNTTSKTPIREISINLSEDICRLLMQEITKLSQEAVRKCDLDHQKYLMDMIHNYNDIVVRLKSNKYKKTIIDEIRTICSTE